MLFDILINANAISLKTIVCSIMVIGGVYFVGKAPEEETEDVPNILEVE